MGGWAKEEGRSRWEDRGRGRRGMVEEVEEEGEEEEEGLLPVVIGESFGGLLALNVMLALGNAKAERLVR